MTKEQAIKVEIAALNRKEYLVASNEGTFPQTEACRAVGSADPAVAVRRVYETVGGSVRSVGPRDASAPGRMRSFSHPELVADRKRVAELMQQLKEIRA